MSQKNQNIRYLFGKNLREVRKSKGISQKQLAEKLGIKQNSISNYEGGVSFPEVEIVEKILDVLDISRDVLFNNINDLDKNIPIKFEDSDSRIGYSKAHTDIIQYLEELEADNAIPVEILNKLKSHVLKMYSDLLEEHQKYNKLRDVVKKELNLPI